MILSQEHKKKHYFFLLRTVVVCFLMSASVNKAYAQIQHSRKENAEAEKIPFKGRWGIKTNAVDWLLTVPNIGVEFDLGNTIRNKRTIGANIKWNWNTSQKYTPSLIFNVFDARVEWRQYFRTRRRYTSTTLKEGVFKYLNDNIFTTKRKNPRDWRAYYWGIYANASSYNLKLGKQGIQGNSYGAGISLGYTAPLYGYRKNHIDLELGGSIGLAYADYDVFEHDAESGCYPRIADKCKGGHLVPFPLITDLRVAFVYRFISVKDKYKQSVTRRVDIREEKRNRLNAAINKMRARIDSLNSVYSKQGAALPDSLLNKEEQKEWKKMQKEAQLKAQEEADKKLQQQIADSLGIQLSDTVPLTKDQQKALRKAEKAIKKANEAARKDKIKKAEDKKKKEGEEAESASVKEKKKKGRKNRKQEAAETEAVKPEDTAAPAAEADKRKEDSR